MPNALVIGASGGIGAEISRALAADGFSVWGTYFADEEGIKKLAAEFKSGFRSVQMDAGDESSITAAFKTILKDALKIDVLVYSVTPPIGHAPILKSEWTGFQKHLDAQVKGFYLTVKALEPQIRESYKTKIIALLSEYCCGKPASGISDYITAKYALLGMAKAFAVELSRYNTTVNMLSPGMTETDLIAGLPPKAVELTVQSNPFKRIAVPKDIANAVSFLASSKADYLNGVNLLINGGGVMN